MVPKLETLNEMTHLRGTDFGRPYPRHGLRLLYWLAHDGVNLDNNHNTMTLCCNPRENDYGFHYFENREEDGCQLLPALGGYYQYFVLGNLNWLQARDLPEYVRKNYNRNELDSNSDRIIISLNCRNQIDKIYVTEHQGQGNFDHERTYRISKGLLKIIAHLELDEFLRQAGDSYGENTVPIPTKNYNPAPQSPSHKPNQVSTGAAPDCKILIESTAPGNNMQSQKSGGFWTYCTIL